MFDITLPVVFTFHNRLSEILPSPSPCQIALGQPLNFLYSAKSGQHVIYQLIDFLSFQFHRSNCRQKIASSQIELGWCSVTHENVECTFIRTPKLSTANFPADVERFQHPKDSSIVLCALTGLHEGVGIVIHHLSHVTILSKRLSHENVHRPPRLGPGANLVLGLLFSILNTKCVADDMRYQITYTN